MTIPIIGADQAKSAGDILLINPPFVHFSGLEMRDPAPGLPTGLLYVGQLLEQEGARVSYFDAQRSSLCALPLLGGFDHIGITTMGAQNIAPVSAIYRDLVKLGVPAQRIWIGGQGSAGLSQSEFAQVFPGARQAEGDLFRGLPSYWGVDIGAQLAKFSLEEQRAYLSQELTLLLSQGCMYGCNFCGAEVNKRETFFDSKKNLETYLAVAKRLGIDELKMYCTSLDLFQQALPGGDLRLLTQRLEQIADAGASSGVTLRLRALTRADAYLAAMERGLLPLVKEAGFYYFGLGADGAADVSLLKAMRKGTVDLKADLFKAYEHTAKYGFLADILYVFGAGADSPATLQKTLELCKELLATFPNTMYRGFPAKDHIPGNKNWRSDPAWLASKQRASLLAHPELFANLGFETLANGISHPDEAMRKLVNASALELSMYAHELQRVQSFPTLPLMATDGHELMDAATFEVFRRIVGLYAPEEARQMTLESLPELRSAINAKIPKDI